MRKTRICSSVFPAGTVRLHGPLGSMLDRVVRRGGKADHASAGMDFAEGNTLTVWENISRYAD